MKKFVKESLYEKFTKDGDPIRDLGIGMIKEITSEALSYLYDPTNQLKEIKKEDPELANLIEVVQDLEAEGIIQLGNYFDYTEEDEMWDYIYKKSKGRFYYNGTPDSDGVAVVFSKIKLPSAEEIEH